MTRIRQCGTWPMNVNRITPAKETFSTSSMARRGRITVKTDYSVYHCCCSTAKSRPTLCNPMDCSMPGFPVLHYLPEFAQTQAHCL